MFAHPNTRNICVMCIVLKRQLKVNISTAVNKNWLAVVSQLSPVLTKTESPLPVKKHWVASPASTQLKRKTFNNTTRSILKRIFSMCKHSSRVVLWPHAVFREPGSLYYMGRDISTHATIGVPLSWTDMEAKEKSGSYPQTYHHTLTWYSWEKVQLSQTSTTTTRKLTQCFLMRR